MYCSTWNNFLCLWGSLYTETSGSMETYAAMLPGADLKSGYFG